MLRQPVFHADETRISYTQRTAYVWVFAKFRGSGLLLFRDREEALSQEKKLALGDLQGVISGPILRGL